MFDKKDAEEVAKYLANILEIKNKQIVIHFGTKHEFASAQVRKILNGEKVSDNTETYDTIEITLFDIKQYSLSPWLEKQLFISRILHELLHIKFPNWGEDTVQDAEANLIGIMMNNQEKEYNKSHNEEYHHQNF